MSDIQTSQTEAPEPEVRPAPARRRGRPQKARGAANLSDKAAAQWTVRGAPTNGDYTTALMEWRPRAAQGDVLGHMYCNGLGVVQSYAEAAKWWQSAAAQGDVHAQSSLGHLYYNGLGVVQSYAEAARLFWLAAEQGHAVAQNKLGLMYIFDRGVSQDDVLAYMWFHNAAAQGNCQRRSKISPPGRSKTSPLDVMRYAVLGGCPGSP